jgi:TetR/AcrR family transcriptional regulator, transcriptional repressor for nem operon
MVVNMRYRTDDKEKTRKRILSAAARRYRSEGFGGVGIANLMADLGMTHGGFYAHFIDKEALVAAVCDTTFSTQVSHWDSLLRQHTEARPLETIARDYLSQQHRDHPDRGCLAAALGGEMSRRDTRSRAAFTRGVRSLLEHLQKADENINPEAALALMVGAMVLARAVSAPDLSDRFLDSARQALLEPEAPPR